MPRRAPTRQSSTKQTTKQPDPLLKPRQAALELFVGSGKALRVRHPEQCGRAERRERDRREIRDHVAPETATGGAVVTTGGGGGSAAGVACGAGVVVCACALALIACMCGPASAQPGATASWAAPEIATVVSDGLMAQSAATFRPDDPLTEADFADVLATFGVTLDVTDPTETVSMRELDARLVTSSGLRPVTEAAAAEPPSRGWPGRGSPSGRW